MNTHQPQDMSPEANEISRNARSQVAVGVALVFFTLVAVAVSYAPFHSQTERALAVITVAALNAVMVTGISMHLKTEKKIIARFLIFTLVFVVGLFALTVLAFFDSTGLP